MKDTVLDVKDSFSKHDDGMYAKGRGSVKEQKLHPEEYEDLEIIHQSELDQQNLGQKLSEVQEEEDDADIQL